MGKLNLINLGTHKILYFMVIILNFGNNNFFVLVFLLKRLKFYGRHFEILKCDHFKLC